jgi:hypothetical protein
MNGRTIARVLLMVHLVPGNAVAEGREKSASDYGGCYTVTLSSWRSRHAVDERLIPPAAIELTKSRLGGAKQGERFLVKPAPGAKALRVAMAYWYVTPEGHVDITFGDGFSGVALLLTPKGSALLGTATMFAENDDGEAAAVAGARLDRVACGPRS